MPFIPGEVKLIPLIIKKNSKTKIIKM